ncbi:biliverdin-producing heme oxygenase [Sphingomonas xanthus]|uniref:Biliverdin-producing heme oxygenase n=1 Tax=Sphingomonas xanthus TaxID=2594473 RepID=A0A516IPT8_9SPHN|nr:biliverdin-producing heme oxygenase [Sphingomonas xanthus]QDP18933.1 biliverdin-producing heme oxygenase [Sphingomonas xanthus]
MSAHAELREATREAHDAIDAAFSALNLGERDDYAAFLTAHAMAFLPVEQALADSGADELFPGWLGARRADLLLADLDALGIAVPPPEQAPTYADRAALLGGLYVIEGSRLGGKLLRREVGEGLSAGFLNAETPPGHWRAFLAILDRLIYSGSEQRGATDAAIHTFQFFGRAAGRVIER